MIVHQVLELEMAMMLNDVKDEVILREILSFRSFGKQTHAPLYRDYLRREHVNKKYHQKT